MRKIKVIKWLTAILAAVLLISVGIYLSGSEQKTSAVITADTVRNEETGGVQKGRAYSTKYEVAEYIHLFNSLPPNYITKKEAHAAGWDNSRGNLWHVTDRRSIGGDVFRNREGLLPKANGREYFECDINYKGGHRGPERIVYSNDGLIFYSGDHYRNFERIY